MLTGYLGLLLMGGAYVAIGVMASSLTRNQIVAFILAFAISFALFIFGQVVQYAPDVARARALVPEHGQPLRISEPRGRRLPATCSSTCP